MSAALSRRVVAVAVLCLLGFVTFDFAPWLIKQQIAEDAPSHERWRFWLATISGNWSPEAPHSTITEWEFAYSAIVAVLLNNSLIFVVILLVWRLVTEWRRRMRLDQAFVTRDQMNKQALFQALFDRLGNPDLIPLIDDAFREGQNNWFSHMVAVFGEDEARRVTELLNKEI